MSIAMETTAEACLPGDGVATATSLNPNRALLAICLADLGAMSGFYLLFPVVPLHAAAAAGAGRVLWGRCLFVVALLELGAAALAAALAEAMSLAPMGLVAVFLVVAMLWESPAAQWEGK